MAFEAIGIVCQDIKKSVEFYGVLGLKFEEVGGGGDHLEAKTSQGVRIMLDTAELIKSFNPGWQPRAGTGMALAFRQDSPAKVDSIFKKLRESGSKSVKEPWDAFWGHRYACLQDPDGNQVDLFAEL